MSRDEIQPGTWFLLFPQAPVLAPYHRPERIQVSPPPGSIGPGPRDERAYVSDAIGEPHTLRLSLSTAMDRPRSRAGPAQPPGAFRSFGARRPRLCRGPSVRLRPTDARHLGGLFRRADSWHFARDYPSIELIPLVEWDNAQSGYGFVGRAGAENLEGVILQFALSLDTIAHEIGHSIIFSEVGIPVGAHQTAEFLAFHEATADVVALICSMWFDAVLDHVLQVTRGDLYVQNEISRIAELSQTEQIRVASNNVKMADVAGIWLDASGAWHDADGLGRHAHKASASRCSAPCSTC